MIKFVMDFNMTRTDNSSDEFNSSQHLNAGKYTVKMLPSNLNVCRGKLTGFIQVKHYLFILTTLGLTIKSNFKGKV